MARPSVLERIQHSCDEFNDLIDERIRLLRQLESYPPKSQRTSRQRSQAFDLEAAIYRAKKRMRAIIKILRPLVNVSIRALVQMHRFNQDDPVARIVFNAIRILDSASQYNNRRFI
jgi:DNA-binding ferritin-like protein